MVANSGRYTVGLILKKMKEVCKMISIDLSRKIAIVTGGGDGIGKAICFTLAKAGASVVVADINFDSANEVSQAIKKMGASSIAVQIDVTKEEDANKLIQTAVTEFGTLDILVNNAGVSRAVPFSDITKEEWDRVFDVNAKGVFLCCRAAIPYMISKKQGKIVNLSSMVGKEAIPFFVHYSSTKFAVMGLTQGLAKELAEHDINVNAVCPGVVKTPLWDPLLTQLSQEKGITRDEAFEEFVKGIPLKRPQEAEDIANVVAFLCSDLAKNMTGQGINVTGGMQMH